MKLNLGFSPCPNDTFIFEALVNKKIDTEGLEFDVVMADVEQLNKWALNAKLDVSKLSFYALTKCISKYILLDSGAALGRNCGPLLIKKPENFLTPESKIAIPGEYTTANFLLSISNPEYLNKVEVLFSEIENEVILGNFDAGLIIHENRFTYHLKGLEKVVDLGEFWEHKYGLPLPLGGIAVKRSLSFEIQRTIERVLRKSVEYALKNRYSSEDFIKLHAQEMDKDIIDAHISLYVNRHSCYLGSEGRDAINIFFKTLKLRNDNIFL
tara:strand:- start:380 stop:1183 length:804 start_codon:yes stop_codon:yes gene_type:complete